MSLFEKSISDRFEQMVQLFPSRTAVRDQGGACSYDELNRNANRIARMVAADCASQELPVVLLLEQGLAQIAATMGVLKAGGFYVPMDPSNPADRNRHMLGDSGAEVIITNNKNRSLAEELSQGACQIVNVDEIPSEVSHENLNESASPGALAYILYTSGSTGNPKGVMHNHRNVLHNVMRHVEAFNITHEDNQMLLYTSSVYGGQRDMFNALLNGASLHVYVVKNEGINGLAEWLVKNDITIYCSVATVFRMFVQTLDGSIQFDKLRLIKLGGEASFKRDIDSYQNCFSDACVVHCGLGSTETGLVRNFFVSKATEVPGNQIPLGYPVEGVDIELLNEAGAPVAAGETGEITIKSRYISLGYWRNSSLTETVFSSDPDDGDIRIYRTGDLGVIYPDGCLEHRGRKDFQIKIKGNRVEVAEVELVLLHHNAVKEAVVVGWKDPQGTDKLVAYLVSENSAEKPRVGELRRVVEEALPVYMVPSFFIWLDAMPLLPNGKIDRKQFPSPDSVEAELSGTYMEPRSGTESRLVEIWRKILRKSEVGVLDNFFELGGESLNAVAMFSMLEKEMGVNLPTSVLVNNPTVSALSKIIDEGGGSEKWSSLVPFRMEGARPPLFVVHGVGGGVMFYKKLIPYLPAEQPLYALQAKGLDGKRVRINSIEKLAESYLKEIRAAQPHGPYYLGGFSFGGGVAMELARRLRDAGESVDLLAIFDSWPPRIIRNKQLKRIFKKICVMLSHPLGFMVKEMFALVRHLFNRPRRWRAVRSIRYSLKYLFSTSRAKVPVAERRQYVMYHHRRIREAYRPDPYMGDILLLYTSAREKRALKGWEEGVSGRVTARCLPGKHTEIFDEPYIAKLAEELNRYLT